MPTYEYRCKDCGHELEVVQSFSEDSLTECPVCSGALKKVFHPVGISFKGSGFYKTDARSGAGKGRDGAKDKAEKSEKSEKSESSSSSDSKPDKKSDKKSDSSGGSSSKTEAKSA